MTCKTATVQYKPVTSLAGNNNVLAHTNSHTAMIKYTYIISYSWLVQCNLLDIISIYSLNPGKIPDRFSYERPGYK